MPSHWYTDNQGRKRRIPDRANKTTFIQASREIDSLLRDKSYSSFVKRLGSAIKDPKVRLLLIKGRQDGLVKDDLIKNTDVTKKLKRFYPTQTEIDIESSLKWIGEHPENVPTLLKGGTVSEKNFAGNSIITSKGKYIIDGHHRWSQVYLINPDAKVKTIDLQISDPEKALRVSQMTVAGLSGELVLQKVPEGKNLYKMPLRTIQKQLDSYLSPSFYQAFYDTQPNNFKTKQDVQKHIMANIKSMRKNNRPSTRIKREYMPQYDKIGVEHAVKSLSKGEININKPYTKTK